MKKKLALVLCLVLCMTVFAGCSSAEIGYLKLAGDMVQTMPMHEEGSTEVYYDADGLKAYITDQAVKYGWSTKAAMDEAFSGFTGSKTIVLDYVADLDYSGNDMRFIYDINVTVDKVKMPIGKIYFSMANGVYADSSAVWNVYQMAEKLIPGYTATDAYRSDLKAALTKETYVQLASAKDLTGESITGVPTPIPSGADYMKIYDSVMKFLEDGFKDYTTNVVTAANGGYRVSVSGDQMIQMVSGLMDYAVKNFDTIEPAFMTYVKTVSEIMGLDTEGAFDKPLDAETKAAVTGVFAAAQTQVDAWIKAGDLDFMKPFAYEANVKKSGDTYVQDCTFSLTVNAKKILSVKTESKVSKSTKEIVIPTAGATLDSMMKAADVVNSKHNPVKSAEVVWAKSTPSNYDASKTECEVTYNRDQDMLLSNKSESDLLGYKNIDQQMYLPLRTICEKLGEEVGWDNAAKQAFITRDGAKTVMTGVVIDGTTYIKIADFAKLDYKVVYDGSASVVHKSTISR